MKNQKKSVYAFTLIEMIIVMIIIGILLMATLYLSWDQIQKVKDKTVKEAILAEMQSRYSRNLWSSSFAWTLYSTMDVTFSGLDNKISFTYNARNTSEEKKENVFTDKFEIKKIIHNYEGVYFKKDRPLENIKLIYSPYQISCKIWEDEESYNNVVMVIRVNDSRDYCFEIKQKNCRLMEMSESRCKELNILEPKQ